MNETASANTTSKQPTNLPVQNRSYSQEIQQSPEFMNFQVDFAVCLNELKDYFLTIITGNFKTPETLLKKTSSLLRPGQTTIDLFDTLHNLRSVDDSIYVHSLNVALISRMIGKWLKMPAKDLETLTLAGLLHDTGKSLIPDDLLNKQDKLTDEEYDLLCQHSQLGYDLLMPLPLDPRVKKDEIDDFAHIIAIADVYDAMTAARTYRAALCPFQVIAEFEKDGLQKYKPKYILTFLEHIASTYQNNRVLLSDGRAANIVLLNRNHLSKPLVQLNNGECIDLARSELYINSLI